MKNIPTRATISTLWNCYENISEIFFFPEKEQDRARWSAHIFELGIFGFRNVPQITAASVVQAVEEQSCHCYKEYPAQDTCPCRRMSI